MPHADTQQALDNLITTLTNYTDIKPAIDPTAYSRDVKDDYLIAQSMVHDVPYLVTGDAGEASDSWSNSAGHV